MFVQWNVLLKKITFLCDKYTFRMKFLDTFTVTTLIRTVSISSAVEQVRFCRLTRLHFSLFPASFLCEPDLIFNYRQILKDVFIMDVPRCIYNSAWYSILESLNKFYCWISWYTSKIEYQLHVFPIEEQFLVD